MLSFFFLILIGFIKFVVEPTLDLLGDVLDSILAQMHAANAGKATAAENGGVSGPKQSVSNGPKSSLAYEPINRPWRETLPANKEKWQEYDAKGESLVNADVIFGLKAHRLFQNFCVKVFLSPN